MIKKITYALAVILVVIQFIPMNNEEVNSNEFEISKNFEVPDHVATLLQGACNNCHSNTTTYPWYANLQPIGFWLKHHVDEGKEHLNFSEFTSLPLRVQNHKFEEIVEMVESKEMPLPSYTYFGLHPEANLSDADRTVLVEWAKEQMALLAATYPADSLKMKPRPAPAE
jgi:Haem-binding domain